MRLNKKKPSNRFECIKISLDLSCQRGRNGRQGCPRGGLRLTKGQAAVREIGLPFFFVLIYKMKWFYNVGTVPALPLKNNHATRCARAWQFLIPAGTILLNSERGEIGGRW